MVNAMRNALVGSATRIAPCRIHRSTARYMGLVVILLLLAAICCSAEQLCFVQISDVHVCDQDSQAYLNRAVDWLNSPDTFGKLHPSFVVLTGDLTARGTEEELTLCKAALDRLSIPYYVIPGNHDISDEHPDTFEKLFPGRLNYEMDTAGYRLLFHRGDTEKSAGISMPPIKEWLEQEISKTPEGTHVVLFTHYPYGNGVKYAMAGRKEVINVLRQRPLLAILSGHFHGDTTVVEDGILFKTIPCLSSTRNNHDGTTAKGTYLYLLDGSCVSAKFYQAPG